MPKRQRGFTLIELLIVIGITVALSVFLFLGLVGRRSENDLQTTATQIEVLLREAQSRSVSQTSQAGWGVHFENSTSTAPFFALFSGVYSSSTRVGYYRLPPRVAYVTSTLALGATYEIMFTQLRGISSASTSIGLYLIGLPSHTAVVSVGLSGLVNRQ